MAEYINWRRLLAGAAVVAAVLIPLYFLTLKQAPDTGDVAPAALLEAPAAAGVSASGVGEGKLAPNFELSRPDGSRVRLSELRGRPVLINFWATWCGSCLSEMPEIKALQQERGADAFVVLAVNAGESRARALEFIDFLGAPFVYGLDVDLRVTDAYGVYGLPLSVFVDSTGVIQAVYRGHANRTLLERFLDAAIKAQPPGEVPAVVRVISTIPRQRVLTVRQQQERVVLASRSLRCDASYCADGVIQILRALPGVVEVRLSRTGAETEVTVALSGGGATAAETVVQTLARALEANPDPLYEGPLEVRYEGG